jgi:hypothetical protein
VNQSVITVCRGASESLDCKFDKDVENVLRCCGSDRLFSVIKTLTEISTRTTLLSERDALESSKAIAACAADDALQSLQEALVAMED